MMIQWSRRDFLARSAGAALAAGVLGALPRRAFASRAVRADTEFFEWKEISKGVLVALNRTGDNLDLAGGNSTLFVHDSGSLLVDAKQAAEGNTLKRELGPRTKQLARIINTHHHFDHSGGNVCFGEPVLFTMHQHCAKRLAESGQANLAGLDKKIEAIKASGLPGAEGAAADAKQLVDGVAKVPADAFAPKGRTRTIGTSAPLKAAGRSLTLHHFGPGHTDNDVVVHDADANIVVAGDVVFNRFTPYFDVAGGANSTGWLHSLRELRKLCNDKTIVVPGHGAVGDHVMVDELIEYFEKTVDAVNAAIKAGKPREEVAKMSLPEYQGYPLAAALPYLWGGIYDEFSPAKSVPKPSGS